MKKFLLLFFLLGVIFVLPQSVSAKTVNAYLFYGKECPHCAELEEYLNSEYKNDKDLKIYRYEVWHNQENQKLWEKVQDAMCIETSGVPYFVIGDKVVRGYNKGSAFENKIDTAIRSAKGSKYEDRAGKVLGVVKGTLKEKDCNSTEPVKETEHKLDIPLIGSVDLEMISIPVVAIIIGFVDGFNPCAMWVLIFLITLLITMKDRKRMWTLGLTFIFTSGFIYFLFMLGVLEIRSLTSSLIWLRALIAIFALIFGGYNIYRYIKTVREKEEGCDVVDKDERKKIMLRAKKAVSSNKFILAIIGIIALACTVNFIELLCSLGLPVMFTEILNYNNITGIKSIVYIIIYVLFFLLDDLVIFFIAMKTLKITAISNKYTKYSHLIGGLIMVLTGLLMLLRPEWLMFNF